MSFLAAVAEGLGGEDGGALALGVPDAVVRDAVGVLFFEAQAQGLGGPVAGGAVGVRHFGAQAAEVVQAAVQPGDDDPHAQAHGFFMGVFEELFPVVRGFVNGGGQGAGRVVYAVGAVAEPAAEGVAVREGRGDVVGFFAFHGAAAGHLLQALDRFQVLGRGHPFKDVLGGVVGGDDAPAGFPEDAAERDGAWNGFESHGRG